MELLSNLVSVVCTWRPFITFLSSWAVLFVINDKIAFLSLIYSAHSRAKSPNVRLSSGKDGKIHVHIPFSHVGGFNWGWCQVTLPFSWNIATLKVTSSLFPFEWIPLKRWHFVSSVHRIMLQELIVCRLLFWKQNKIGFCRDCIARTGTGCLKIAALCWMWKIFFKFKWCLWSE